MASSAALVTKPRPCMLLVAAIALLLYPHPSDAESVVVEGRLSALDSHGGDVKWHVITGKSLFDKDSHMYELPEGYLPPNGIDAGQWVQLSCILQGPADAYSCASNSRINAVTLPSGSGLPPGYSASSVDQQEINLLVLIVTFTGSCQRAAGYTVVQVNAMYMSSGDGWAQFFRDCSYGKMTINQDKFKILTTPVLCTPEMLECNHLKISEAADRAAELQLQQGALAAYTHVHYIMPRGIRDACPSRWAGLAAMPGARVWLQPDADGLENKGTVLQEVLHNFGLRHAWKGGFEYEDYTSCMGRGRVCPSPYELGRMGWATALAVLEERDLIPGVPMRYVLPATYLPNSNRGAFLRIRPTWLGNAGWMYNLYMGYRASGGADAAMLPEYSSKLTIHRVERFIDDTHPNAFAAPEPYVELVGVLDSDILDQWQGGTRYQLVVQAGLLLQSGTHMEVTLCRFVANPIECPSSGPGSADSTALLAPKRLLPPPPPPQRPPPSPAPSKRPQPSPPPPKRPPPSPKRPPPSPPPPKRPPPSPPPPYQPAAYNPTIQAIRGIMLVDGGGIEAQTFYEPIRMRQGMLLVAPYVVPELTASRDKQAFINGYELQYRYVCDKYNAFDDDIAQIMCNGMGFAYGRLFYKKAGNFEVGSKFLSGREPARPYVFGSCGPRLTYNRYTPYELQFQDGLKCGFGDAMGSSNPLSLPYECFGQAVVGVQCSGAKLPTAPPPGVFPPSPPPPSPAPPYRDHDIKLVIIEANIDTPKCPASELACESQLREPRRVELMVDGEWAPLCWPSNGEYWMEISLANATCWQANNYPYSYSRDQVDPSYLPKQGATVHITASASKDDFVYTAYKHVVLLPNEAPENATAPLRDGKLALKYGLALQDLGLKLVTATKAGCPLGLLTVFCGVWSMYD